MVVKMPLRRYKTYRKESADQQLIGHSTKNSLFFRDTRDHPEHDAKNRLSLPSPSPEKPLAEIDELKNNRPYDPNSCVIIKKFWKKNDPKWPDFKLCHHKFDMTSRLPPFKKWKRLSMSANERKRILMSITFHVIALACVVWSLYVLIGKTWVMWLSVTWSIKKFRKNRRRIEKSWYKMAILDKIGCCRGWLHRWFGLHVCSG